MLKRKISFVQAVTFFTGLLTLLIALSAPATVYADGPTPPPDNGKCISCHEDLYFLHDTGNWFCLKESPMACVDCHGGDPVASVKELAHTNRAPHPVVNDNISKCQECHPDQCTERVGIFKQTAGISKVLVAVPLTPSYSSEIVEAIPITGQQVQESNTWANATEIVSLLLIISIVLVIYIVYKVRRTAKGSS